MRRFIVFFLIVAISVGIGFGAQSFEEYMIKKNHPLKFTEYVEKYAEEFDIPKALLYSVIKCESSFDPEAKSRVGARGLMQLMPKTFEEMARRQGEEYREELMYDPDTSIRYGSYYLNYLYNIFGDWKLVLAAYNGGMGNVRKWMEDSEYFDGVKIIKYPKGFGETEQYVERVTEAEKVYTKLWFNDNKNTYKEDTLNGS